MTAAGSTRAIGSGGGGSARLRVVKNTSAIMPAATARTTSLARFCHFSIDQSRGPGTRSRV